MFDMGFENNQEEWKEIWDASYLKAIAAFYNTDGGRMIVGRRDDGEFVGLKDPKGDAKKISDTINNKLHISPNVHIQDFDGKMCVVIDVSSGSRMVSLDSRFYKRVGNTNQELSGDELKVALLGEDRMSWLDRTCDIRIEDLSDEAISFFVQSGKKNKRINPDADEHDAAKVISSYDLARNGKLTLTTGILFHPTPRRLNDAAFLKIGFFDDKGVLRREDYVEGPVIMIPDKAIRILYDRYIQDTYGYGGKTAQRHIVHKYPEDALRELIVNAIVHKDYHIQEPTTIRVYEDRIDIFCFGGLPKGWSPDMLTKKHDSIRRNRLLASVFFAAGYVENWGQGIEKVINQCRANGNPDPVFTERCGGLSVEIGINPAKDVSDIPQPIINLDEKNRIILGCIEKDPGIPARAISENTGISINTVERRLKKMTEQDLLRREGSTKSGKWIIVHDNL